MSKYRGKAVVVNGNVEDVFSKIANLGAYQQYVDNMPDDIKAKLDDVRFTDDSIVLNANPVGEIVLKQTRLESPSLIEMQAQNSPVPMALSIVTSPVGDSTEVVPSIDVEIPAMLRPLVGGKLQEAADKMSEILGMLLNR